MNTNSRFLGLDVFKLIVALLLLLILIILWLRLPAATTPVAEAPDSPTSAALDTTTPEYPPFPEPQDAWTLDSNGQLLSANGNAVYVFDPETNLWVPIVPNDIKKQLPEGAELKPNGDGGWMLVSAEGETLYQWDVQSHSWAPVLTATTTSTTAPTETTVPSTQTSTPLTATETTAPTATAALAATNPNTPPPPDPPTAEAPGDTNAGCTPSLTSRLAVGDNVRTLTSLNMRSEPQIGGSILGANYTGSQLEIIGGPVCTTHQNGAYNWWQVQTADGRSGWSAEGSLFGEAYFMEVIEE